jgi:hypothetical protein
MTFLYFRGSTPDHTHPNFLRATILVAATTFRTVFVQLAGASESDEDLGYGKRPGGLRTQTGDGRRQDPLHAGAGIFGGKPQAALDVNDIEETEGGLRVTIRYSKTDQDGQGVTIAIASGDVACPVKALRGYSDIEKIGRF